MDNPLKLKLARGEPVLGYWSVIASPMLVELFGRAGFDFVILDQEHGAYDLASLEHAIRAAEVADCSPLVRVPGPDQFAAQKALDLGAHGIVVPQAADGAAVARAVALAKYPPAGVRGFNPYTRAAGYDPPPSIPHGKLDDRFVLTCAIIETAGAYRDLDAIVAQPGLDVVYLGAYDMSNALGCAGDVTHPKVIEFLEVGAAKARAAGKSAGLLVRSPAEIEWALKLGIRFLVYGVDTFLAYRAGAAAVAALKAARA